MVGAREYWDAVEDENDFQSVWCLKEVGKDFDRPHTYPGATTVVYRNHWGQGGEVRVAIQGVTWLDLYRAADQAIRESGDCHHVFIEAFDVEGNTLVLWTGS